MPHLHFEANTKRSDSSPPADNHPQFADLRAENTILSGTSFAGQQRGVDNAPIVKAQYSGYPACTKSNLQFEDGPKLVPEYRANHALYHFVMDNDCEMTAEHKAAFELAIAAADRRQAAGWPDLKIREAELENLKALMDKLPKEKRDTLDKFQNDLGFRYADLQKYDGDPTETNKWRDQFIDQMMPSRLNGLRVSERLNRLRASGDLTEFEISRLGSASEKFATTVDAEKGGSITTRLLYAEALTWKQHRSDDDNRTATRLVREILKIDPQAAVKDKRVNELVNMFSISSEIK
jgi:hypothetical protein